MFLSIPYKQLRVIALSCFTLAIWLNGQAQIAFVNPDIERTPCTGCANCVAPGWTNCALTPDVQPGYYGVTTPAQSGCTYAGFATGEYIGQRLACPLISGKNYQFSMCINSACG